MAGLIDASPHVRRLDRYLVRQAVPPFVAMIAVLLLGLSLERLLRLIRLVVSEGAPVGRAFELLAYLLPHYLGLSLTVGFFLACLLALRRLHERSELVIYFAGGVSPRRLATPLLASSLVLMAAMAWLGSSLQPWTRYQYRAALWEVKKTGVLSNLQPGVFQRLSKAVVIRAEEIGGGGLELGRFFAAIGETPGKRTIMVAEAASLRDHGPGNVMLDLKRGEILHEEGDRPPFVVHFGEYPWQLPLGSASTYGARGQDARELTTGELLRRKPTIGALLKPAEQSAELQSRFVQVAALPVLALLAVPLAMLGRGRTGRAWGLMIGLAMLIAFQQLLGFGKAMAGKGHLPAVVGLWAPFALLCLPLGWFAWRTRRSRARRA